MSTPQDPRDADLPAVLDVRLVALQEIDRIVGNESCLSEGDTTALRGLIQAALSTAPGPAAS